jgi:hypothetical protein
MPASTKSEMQCIGTADSGKRRLIMGQPKEQVVSIISLTGTEPGVFNRSLDLRLAEVSSYPALFGLLLRVAPNKVVVQVGRAQVTATAEGKRLQVARYNRNNPVFYKLVQRKDEFRLTPLKEMRCETCRKKFNSYTGQKTPSLCPHCANPNRARRAA